MKSTKALALVTLGILFSANLFAAGERSYIDARSASDENVPPFSGAVMVGDTLYVSGSLGLVDGNVP